jgi:hypothetical protein
MFQVWTPVKVAKEYNIPKYFNTLDGVCKNKINSILRYTYIQNGRWRGTCQKV